MRWVQYRKMLLPVNTMPPCSGVACLDSGAACARAAVGKPADARRRAATLTASRARERTFIDNTVTLALFGWVRLTISRGQAGLVRPIQDHIELARDGTGIALNHQEALAVRRNIVGVRK